jgi:hypothetical protein
VGVPVYQAHFGERDVASAVCGRLSAERDPAVLLVTEYSLIRRDFRGDGTGILSDAARGCTRRKQQAQRQRENCKARLRPEMSALRQVQGE